MKKHDEPILKHLRDIRGWLHEEGFGMTLEFEFGDEAKSYFEEGVIRKTYHMVDEGVLEKTECSAITWKEGKNVTMKQTLKKQKNKRTGEIREVP